MAIEAECGHCTCAEHHQTRVRAVPVAREPLDGREATGALDSIGEEERWLWRLVTDAERVEAQAPPRADPQRLAETEQRLSLILSVEQKVFIRIRATEAALARPTSWLRPAHRAALSRHLREDRAVAVATAVQRGRIEESLSRLRTVAHTHQSYLAEHHTVLAAGRNARAELDGFLDDLIDAYARLTSPPAWFRFGLGFPPPPGAQPEWLMRARQAIAHRRRLSFDQPKW